MKDWKDKALENSFPKKPEEPFITDYEDRKLEGLEQKIRGFFKGLLILVLILAAIAAIIGLILFLVDSGYLSFDLRTWLIIGIVAVCIQLERVIHRMPR